MTNELANPEVFVASVHVPKAAGTSLERAFVAAYGEDQVQRVDDSPLDPAAMCNLDPAGYLAHVRAKQPPENVQVIHGHVWAKRFEAIDAAVRVTFLRDPVMRAISHYAYWRESKRVGHTLLDYVRGNDLTLLEFARLPMIANIYTDVFFRDVDMAMFDLIGDAGRYTDDVRSLGAMLGVSLVADEVNVNPHAAYDEYVQEVIDDYRLMGDLRTALRTDLRFYERYTGSRAADVRTDTVGAAVAEASGNLPPRESQYADARRIEQRVRAGEHRAIVGGMWERIGDMARDFLVGQGLRPSDRLLDVGCGALRVGVKLVPYLEPGNYFGFDVNGPLLDAGYEKEIMPSALDDRLPRSHLAVADGFVVPFDGTFDTVLALSVFTHLPLNDLRVCLERLVAVTHSGSTVFVTYFEAPDSSMLGEAVDQEPGGVRTYGDRNPYHLRIVDLEHVVRGLPFDLEVIGEWGHPRGQRMAKLTRR